VRLFSLEYAQLLTEDLKAEVVARTKNALRQVRKLIKNGIMSSDFIA
jgi:hypothetical protein